MKPRTISSAVIAMEVIYISLTICGSQNKKQEELKKKIQPKFHEIKIYNE
jgi:hypothetical protein